MTAGPRLRLFTLVASVVPQTALAAPLVIDDFSYGDSAAAQAAWRSPAGATPVEMGAGGEWGDDQVMLLPCSFSEQEGRSYWDRDVALDLSPYAQLSLEVYVPDPGPISNFTLYFRSGDGWYSRSAWVAHAGWQTWLFSPFEFGVEGSPAGWDQIDRVRLSPWKDTDQDTFLAVKALRADTPAVVIVADRLTSDTRTVETTTARLLDLLERSGIPVGVLDGEAIERGLLADARLAVLPYNPSMSATQIDAIEAFVAGGGKLMVFYSLLERLAGLLGVTRTGWTDGDLAAYHFDAPTIAGLPVRVSQASWNITIAEPAGTLNAAVIAEWEDSSGLPTGHPAWIASDTGLFMSHILLGDDIDTKRQMIGALAGHYVPELWPAMALAALDRVGRVGPFKRYDEAVAAIRLQGDASPRAAQVEVALGDAAASYSAVLEAQAEGRDVDVVRLAGEAQDALRRAYYLSQVSVSPEFRAVWEHSGTGPFAGDWTAAIDVIADNGFNAVFPNMLWGGVAHYDSALLPHSDEYDELGDQISACVAAAHGRGIEVHVWKVNWNMSRAPQWFIDEMRAAGRTQVSASGVPGDWLCPSHPDNFVLERDSMLEVVANYDVDGVHFDYIRYPDANHCYCDGCRARFEADAGVSVTSWPDEVRAGGPYEAQFLDWRRQQITDLVEAVYQGVQALEPTVEVSAAVFPDASSAYDGVGQDWGLWADMGIVDFLCPMDYTEDLFHFENQVAAQLDRVAGQVPIYPGIGATASRSDLSPDQVISQILTTRAAETGGFIIFNYTSGVAREHLPALGLGTTADDGPTLDAGALDTGALDTGVNDAGAPDTGVNDAGAPDTGVNDAGAPDTGVNDAGAPDMGALDTGVGDPGRPDVLGADRSSTQPEPHPEGCGCLAAHSSALGSGGLPLVALVVSLLRRRQKRITMVPSGTSA